MGASKGGASWQHTRMPWIPLRHRHLWREGLRLHSLPARGARVPDHRRRGCCRGSYLASRSTSVQQDQHQVATGPGGGGIIHGPEHGAGHSGARPSNRTSTPGRPASGRAGPITSGRQRAAESVDSLVGFEEKDEAHLEAYKASHNQPVLYVDLNEVHHTGRRIGEMDMEEAEAELLEKAEEDQDMQE